MLMNMKDLLKVAKEQHFAIPAFNISSNMMLTGVIEACEKANAPVIIEIHPDELSFVRDSFIEAVKAEAHKAKIPVCLHLDHGGSFQDVIRAINDGFTSVMIDSSLSSYEENVALTKQVVQAAHAVNISVEAELGTIGATIKGGEASTDNIIYTKPEDVLAFTEATEVDTLAIAIGTAHGLYPKNKIPHLRLDLLEKIVKLSKVPLVLHGGSNNSDEEIATAVKMGICKINISSDIKTAFYEKCREVLKDETLREPNEIYPPCIKAMQEVVNHKLQLFNTVGKAVYYK
ncbi:MAG: ketose-bisphosphate aldolase [Sphaerochaetaceae bacterium]|nr:ketose-bisphosphate aldolase [Sphaerochaetaceae bacterium]